ncbi:hypothetical protein HUA76_11255 [Myxococcus sp. CA056]|uniref:hypothetical protein n=1 Tax=Myxococcus sp. CA056 TaxID=2741740 RepID=UPI00157B2DDB|nr:hypothetical protein [Myxococcus sp. CA056]NTX11366.1 hypothetical protein [Myxococcus sp. CA056]
MSRGARTGPLLAAMLALVVGAGCPGDVPPESCISGDPIGPIPPLVLVPVGEEASLRVTANPNMNCALDEGSFPESVTAEVQDPDNLPVQATVELTSGWGATLRFTPTMTGRYHVIVAFAPVGSLSQFDVYVAEDERQRPSVARLSGVPQCQHLDRTSSGTWVCDGRAHRGSGFPEQTVGRDYRPSTAVVGNVVWTMVEGQVRRFVDTGEGPLVRAGSALYPTSMATDVSPHTRLATENEYLVLDATTLYRYTFTEELGLSVARTSKWTEQPGLAFGSDSTQVIAMRVGPTLWLVSRFQEPVTFLARTRACPFQLDAQDHYVPVSGQPCQVLAGEPLGHGDGVLWTREVTSTPRGFTSVLHRHLVTAERGLVEEGVLALGDGLSVSVPELRAGPALPVITSFGSTGPAATPRWDAERNALLLVLLPGPGTNTGITRVSDHFTWTVNLDGLTDLRIHPWTSSP